MANGLWRNAKTMQSIAHLIFKEKRSQDDEELNTLRQKIPLIEYSIQQLYDLEEQLVKYQKETDNAQVIVEDKIYAGSIIVMDDFDYFVEEEEENLVYSKGKYGIVRQSLNPSEEDEAEETEE